jgi:hypothetical protein
MELAPRERQERAARNQSLFREVNERIEQVARSFDMTFIEFACECADLECTQPVPLTVEEYEHVRSRPDHFFVVPGHVYRDLERVLEADGTGDRFQVVEKLARAAEKAAELDQRSPAPTTQPESDGAPEHERMEG